MTDLSTLTDTELNERIHELMGNEECPCGQLCGRWVVNGNPQFAHYPGSLDALKSGPEKMLREAGWRLGDTYEALDGTWYVKLVAAYRDTIATRASTEERARAEAVCLGLEAMK